MCCRRACRSTPVLLLDHPDEIALRLLDRALLTVLTQAGQTAPPERLERLERLLGRIAGQPRSREALHLTLRGVLVRLSPRGRLRLLPAPARRH